MEYDLFTGSLTRGIGIISTIILTNTNKPAVSILCTCVSTPLINILELGQGIDILNFDRFN